MSVPTASRERGAVQHSIQPRPIRSLLFVPGNREDWMRKALDSEAEALIQQALYEELSTSRRLRLHGKVGQAMERVYAGHIELHLVELAHHFYEAAPSGKLDPLIDYTLRAGERALARSANTEGIEHLNRGLSLIESLPEGRERDQHELSLRTALGPVPRT